MNKNQPGVLIVILNYGTYNMTISMIKALRKNLDYDNYFIMVVDNCSPNESAEVLEAKSTEMNYVFHKSDINAGYAVGNNIGIRYGIEHGFEYSWILNNDVELREPTVLTDMIRIAESDERIGSVGPKIYSLEGTLCAPYVNRPTLWSMTLGIIVEKKKRQKYNDVSRGVYRLHGCCMLVKNKVMAEINCMDERTFLYGEEEILAERMLAKGYGSYYDASVSVMHKESVTMKKMTTNRKQMLVRESRKSREIYLRDYRRYSAPARSLYHLVADLITYLR